VVTAHIYKCSFITGVFYILTAEADLEYPVFRSRSKNWQDWPVNIEEEEYARKMQEVLYKKFATFMAEQARYRDPSARKELLKLPVKVLEREYYNIRSRVSPCNIH
jgi:hypothetical protein